MKNLLSAAVMLGVVLVMVTGAAAQEKPWFDAKNCAFCKQLGDQPGLLDHMCTEYHNLATGIVTFTHIDSTYLPAFEKAMVGMQGVVKEMQTTAKPPYMCGHCSKYGEFMMAGVKIEEARTAFGIINVYSAPDSTWVPKLHDFGKRSAEAIAQFMKEQTDKK